MFQRLKNFRLGDAVEKALNTVGITEDRVTSWLGRPCGCRRRKEKLNALNAWALRVLTGKSEAPQGDLDSIIKE